MELVIQVQILDEFICILHSANVFGRNLNATIITPPLSPVMRK